MDVSNSGITTREQLCQLIDEVGFLPLFDSGVPGYSVMAATRAAGWWSGEQEHDPWQWRALIAAEGKIAYGKFFQKKAGFVSRAWFPALANYRRDGYDFDARYEDGLIKHSLKQIYDCFDAPGQEEIFLPSFRLRALSGVEKGFEGALASLQMQCYLTIRGMQRKRNKKGEAYGWPCSVYARAEDLFGARVIEQGYEEDPADSKKRILAHLQEILPFVPLPELERLIRG